MNKQLRFAIYNAIIKEIYPDIISYIKKRIKSDMANKVLDAHNNLETSINNLEVAMEDEGVSYDDLIQGRATGSTLDLANTTLKYQILFLNISTQALKKEVNCKHLV